MARPKPARPTGNHLLDRLPAAELDRLLAGAEWVRFGPRDEVFGIGAVGQPVYFPTSAVFSLLLPLKDGHEVEVAVTDGEGMLGIPAVLGLESQPLRAVAQVGGDCVRVTADRFRTALREGEVLDALVKRFLAVSWQTANQNIACNQRHTVRERTCRWLLSVHDRAGTDEFEITQEVLAGMVGASRQKVTVVAGGLQRAGAISYQRGRVRVSDRAVLEAHSCECYRVLRKAYELLTL
jgi:CRP-like cAMP-binding protein